jgi:hypothetical protein
MVQNKRIALWMTMIICGMMSQFAFSQDVLMSRLSHKVEKRYQKWQNELSDLQALKLVPLDSFKINPKDKKIVFYFSKELAYQPFRENQCQDVERSLSKCLGHKFRDYNISIITNGSTIEELIPNLWRKELPTDKKRMEGSMNERIPVVRRLDQESVSSGLYNCNIALWPSHGLYYEPTLDRWEYQRARLFGTVEDLYPMAYILQYLTPMLENAGASVFIPRERDTQVNEVIVDNDRSTGNSELITSPGLNIQKLNSGFQWKDTLTGNDNPFQMGSALRIMNSLEVGQVQYIPYIPEKGQYAVYISYVQDSLNSSHVAYTVKHAGGESHFLVNQKMGGSTWIYLGTFDFNAGKNPGNGSVSIQISGSEKELISADAVRFGGGMGTVARKPLNSDLPKVRASNSESSQTDNFSWKLSGKPRYMEAARYYLQYSGMPDSLVFSLNKNKNDYTDDLQSRGEWVNFLIGKSKSQYRSIFNRGLNIPIDLSFAFHTDAGVTPNDSVIGTLGLYSTEKNNKIFPDGQSKLTNRDLTDIVQSQLVDDIRKAYNPDWVRREMWDRAFSEAYRPVVPAMLLELLSHQNIADMRLGLDPVFRFQVCRSIYIGMLKYLAYQQGRSYVVQPLSVDHLAISPLNSKTIQLSWKPVLDSLEPSARPMQYKVYKRIGDGGFDNGTLVQDTMFILELSEYGKIFSFKVTAINEGGESFPSEILSVGFASEKAPTVLVVNGFDRISGPSIFDTGDMAGISWWDDQGVPDKTDISFLGNQYDFNRKSEWIDDDNAGWGACNTDMDGKIVPGNTFDFTKIHGEAILANGYSFVSVSNMAFVNPKYQVNSYTLVDIILGEEKSTPRYLNPCQYNYSIYTPDFLAKLKEITVQGGGLFLSGAYIGTDIMIQQDSNFMKEVKDLLHFTWRTSHASKTGHVYSTDYGKKWFQTHLEFNTVYHPSLYTVEAPDAIEPAGEGAVTAFRYEDSKCSAGVAYYGKYKSLAMGFPFETILDKGIQKELMFQVLKFLKKP